MKIIVCLKLFIMHCNRFQFQVEVIKTFYFRLIYIAAVVPREGEILQLIFAVLYDLRAKVGILYGAV